MSKQQVGIKRACGHTHQLDCNLKSSALPPCKESITIRSPLCGHEIQCLSWYQRHTATWSHQSVQNFLEARRSCCKTSCHQRGRRLFDAGLLELC